MNKIKKMTKMLGKGECPTFLQSIDKVFCGGDWERICLLLYWLRSVGKREFDKDRKILVLRGERYDPCDAQDMFISVLEKIFPRCLRLKSSKDLERINGAEVIIYGHL